MDKERNLEILRELEGKMREGVKEQAEVVEMFIEMGEMPIMPLNDLDDYDQFEEMGGKDRLSEILRDELGMDLDGGLELEYEIEGTEGAKIRVSVFRTSKEDVFVGKYEGEDGHVDWVLRSREIEEGV